MSKSQRPTGIGLGARIKKLRLENKWSQAELARLSGTSQGGINLIEAQGRDDIRASTVLKFARALRVTTDEILGYDVNAVSAPAAGQDGHRIDELEKGLLRVNDRVTEGFQAVLSRLDAQPLPASKQRPKQNQRKRS